jgi:hypothetical protein
MTSIIETITTAEDKLLETLSGAQQPIVSAVTKAVDAIEDYLPENRPSVPVTKFVNTQLAFGKKGLQVRQDLDKAVVKALAPVFNDKPVARKATVKAA